MQQSALQSVHPLSNKGATFKKESRKQNMQCVSKTIHLTFDHNFGKRRPIYKIISLLDLRRNDVHIRYQDCPPDLKYVSTLPCETRKLQLLLISMAYCT